MKGLVLSISSHRHYSTFLKWGKLLSLAGSAQVLVQAIGLISGILIIRLLPTSEYALYTLANTMLGTMTLLADGGISAGVISQGGKVWQDPKKLGSVLATGIVLRRKFAIGSLIIAAPILLYLLLHHGASFTMSILIVLSLLPAFIMGLTGQLYEIIPKLWQDITPLQKIQVGTNVGRLVLLCLTIFIFPWAFIAILVAGIPQIWANKKLKRISDTFIDNNQKADKAIEKEILTMIKRILPGVVYYCLSTQITIWLISIFGTTSSVAQIGALSRLAMVLSFFNVLFTTLISPRYARLPNEAALLLKRFLQIQAGLFILSLSLIGMVWLFPTQILWVLGSQYSQLSSELVWYFVGSCLSLIAGASYQLYLSRGWTINPFVSIPVNVASIILGTIFFDISTLKGIFILNIFVASVQVVMDVLFILIKITHGKGVVKTVAN